MGSGKLLVRAQEKHGIHNFNKEILHVFYNPEDMFAMEAHIVDKAFVEREDTYNLKVGGFGGFDHLKNYIGSDSHMAQFIEASKGASIKGVKKKEQLRATDPKWNAKVSKNQSESMKRTYQNGFEGGFKGKSHTMETKKKMSAAKKSKYNGNNNPQYGTMWITNGTDNKKIAKDDAIPKGWSKGRKIAYTNKTTAKGKQHGQYGTIWITNGIETKQIKKDDTIPNGWKRGRTLNK